MKDKISTVRIFPDILKESLQECDKTCYTKNPGKPESRMQQEQLNCLILLKFYGELKSPQLACSLANVKLI